jgi:pyrroloquinoline quinone (PQQ) biosynthesis protein C
MANDMLAEIRSAWEKSLPPLLEGEFFRRLTAGTLGLPHYKALMREIYYNSRENTQAFALMAAHLDGGKRRLAPRIFKHCLAESGHPEMALRDLRNLGEDVSGLPAGRPLPTTEALIAFAVYQVQHVNPAAFLGYIYHLEMLPAGKGDGIVAGLRKMGVPENATRFLAEHAEADQVHSQWLEEYLRMTIENDSDLRAVIHCAQGTARLHALMLQGVLESAEAGPDWSHPAGKARPEPARPAQARPC